MRTILFIKYSFFVIGLGMLIGTFFLYLNTQDFLKEALVTQGTVTELVRSRSSDSTVYKPVVKFRTRSGASIEFTSSSGSNPPGYSKGEVVEVLYQENAPEQAKINGFFSLWGGPLILGILGSVFFMVGFSIILYGRLKDKKIKYLKQNGIPVQAKFQSVERNKSFSVNGRSPFQVCVQWVNPATNELHLFNSENIWFDPSDHINTDEITVLIERGNPEKYHVDISFLPKLAGK